MLNFANPYNGEQGATCSVSFGSIADRATVDDDQAEAGFHRAKLLGEFGVIKAKLANGDIQSGTKVLAFDDDRSSGYVYTKGRGMILRRTDKASKETTEVSFTKSVQQAQFGVKSRRWSVPQQADNRGIAAFTPKPPVNIASTSKGSLTDEDVTGMFLQIRDRIAREQELDPIAANVDLDERVYREAGVKAGYTPAEIKAKIDAYKASGKKLSALRKTLVKAGKMKATG